MATVYIGSPTNSTMFTTCCQVAILEHQERCPVCKEEVVPQGRNARWEVAFGPTRRRIAEDRAARKSQATGAS